MKVDRETAPLAIRFPWVPKFIMDRIVAVKVCAGVYRSVLRFRRDIRAVDKTSPEGSIH